MKAQLIERNGPYGHNTYRIFNGAGEPIGLVTGGGDRKATGRSIWWDWRANPTEGDPYGRSGRYCRTKHEAMERLLMAWTSGR